MSTGFFVQGVQKRASQPRRLRVFAAVLLLMLAVSGLGAAGSLEASPLNGPAAPTAVFSIAPTAQSTMWVDANKCNAQGPRGAWLSFVVTNTSGVTQTGVTITFAGFTGANATYFKATQDPLRTVGTLEPGQSTVAYFYVDYAEVCLHNKGGGSPYSGYTANYTVTAASSSTSDVYSGTVTTNELQTTAAAGLVTSNVLGPGAYVGQILPQTVTYSFGVNKDLFFQPAIEANFNDACWRLVDSAITATTGQVVGITLPQANRLWFPNAETKSDATITVTYYWESLCSGAAQTVTPWAAAKSGSPYKYSGASGATLIPPASAAPVTAKKDRSRLCGRGEQGATGDLHDRLFQQLERRRDHPEVHHRSTAGMHADRIEFHRCQRCESRQLQHGAVGRRAGGGLLGGQVSGGSEQHHL